MAYIPFLLEIKMQTPNLALPYVAAGQAQKHVTVNASLCRLDALVHLSVVDMTVSSPPAAPAEGARYIVPAGATGAWSGQAGAVAVWQDGMWDILAPKTGWRAFCEAQNNVFVFRNNGWQVLGDTAAPQMLGINATADGNNRLVVASAASLFDQQGGDHRLKINKSAQANTASVLFQQGYSGRAEMGLTGTSRFQIKGSVDGTLWQTMLDADAASGRVSVSGAPTDPLHIASKAYVDAAVAAGASQPTFDTQLGVNFVHVPGAAWVKVSGFSSVRVGNAGYNSGISRFVAPSPGNYLFIGQIVQTMGASGGSSIGTFGKNGQPVGNWNVRNIPANTQDFMPLQAILSLAAGDYVEVMFNANFATTLTAGYTVFGGTKL